MADDKKHQVREINEQAFIEEVYESHKDDGDVKFVFFIGAGCSSSSDIPTATKLVSTWLNKLRNKQDTKLSELGGQGDLSSNEYYFKVFQSVFPFPIDQQREIKRLCQDKMPSFGYYMLAQLMQKSAFNTVVTTNFDDLIFDALIFSNSKHRPLVISHQNSGHLIERSNIPMIVKMHGDANLQPFNTQESTTDPEKQILEGLKPVLNNTKIIFMGYSGGDKSVCTLLEQCKNIHGVYWLNQNGEPPQGEVKSWWEKSQHTKTLVTYKGFDKLMMLVKDKFNLQEPNFNSFVGKLEQAYRKNKTAEIKQNIRNTENPKTAIDYFLLALNYHELGEYQEAIDACKEAIKIKPDYHEAYYNKGTVYIKLKEYQKAIVAFKKAIKIKPDFYEACTNMGGAYSKLKKYRKAIKAYEKAIKIKPGYYEAHYSMGLAYIKLFELQLIQTQDFDQDLVQKFNMHDNADTTTKIFKMLTIFKSINNGTQVAGWQQAFSQKYQGVLEWNHWEWSNIEKWINSKPNDEKKQALQSALEFFKAQYNPL
ncbi:TPR domain protein, putative component of TonB system [uncultured Gammaproteobacteria bacterium]|nr:TPR domain protein, putative component of TonB system [uncultured Gammaproteobacteria bacterium]